MLLKISTITSFIVNPISPYTLEKGGPSTQLIGYVYLPS